MEQSKIDRINFLAKKSRTFEGLTEKEKEEQALLRQEYRDGVRRNLEGQLGGIKIIDKNAASTPETKD